MNRITRCILVVLLVALPALAQTNDLAQAQQVLAIADSAGAQQFAKSLYDDAAYRIRFAQENMSSSKASEREQARMRAREALFAARAALAKARWAGTNAAIRNMQNDITRFGGRSDLRLQDEDSNINYGRGTTTKERIASAQAAIDQARTAGAEQSVADNDLKTAQETLSSANKVSRNGRDNRDVADHLAYVAEMIARRAYYLARFNESGRALPEVQLQRTRLAQASSEQQAMAERSQREEAERRAAQLQSQLASQEANRQAQAAELERLRQQVDENRRAMQMRVENDRSARLDAARRLDDAMSRYEAAAAAGTADADMLRRQVEDAAIALRAIQERERLNEEAMSAEINALRSDLQTAQGSLDAGVLSQRQADLIRRQNELEQFRSERQSDVTRRTDIQRRHEAAVAAAMQTRQQSEQQAQAMRQQIEAAQQAAQQAAQAAQSAQQQVETTQQQLQSAQQQAQEQLQSVQQQAQQQLQSAQQQAQQQQAEAEKAREEARAAQAELERTRQELGRREADARQQAMEAELARLAQTKRESRGLVVTLPGIFFDTGKSALKPGAKSTLSKIAAQLKGSDNLKISVEGHTDSTGTPEKNSVLSEKRAEAVRDHLVGVGIPADRITASGKGLDEPVATNKTAAGRQQNRRVELIITQ